MVTKGALTAAFLLCLVSGLVWTESFDCKSRKDGFYANPTDCSKFYRCVARRVFSFQCPTGLEFQPTLSVCEWRRNVQCLNGRRPSSDSDAVTEPPSTTTTTTISPTTTTTPATTTTETPTTTRLTTSATTTTTSTTTPAVTTISASATDTSTTSTAKPTPNHFTAYQPSCVGRFEGSMFASPEDCSVYFWCVHGEPLHRLCPADLVFNSRTRSCDWAFNVPDCSDSRSGSGVLITQTIPAKSTATAMQKFTTKRTLPTQKTPSKTSPASVPSAPSVGGGDSGCSRRVCYYTNWSQYRPGNGRFVPENVDPFLCTHVVYAFAKLRGNHLEAFEWNDESTDWSKGMYERFNDLKKINPNLKTLLAVGGWNLASAPFTKMVATDESRQDFADHSVTFLKSNGFDGLDLDWEYPANRGSLPGDKEKFTLLIKQLRETYDKHAAKNGGSPLLLTAAVAAGKSTIDTAYDIPQISQHLDFINLMSYDLHGSWETVTGHHSGLYAHSSESEPESFLNTDWAARYWVSKGCPKDKLVIGIPTYARTFTLRSSSDSSLGAPVTGGGTAGTYTRERGFLAYYEVCNMMATAKVQQRIEDQKVPYLMEGNQWAGYEDVDSVTEKVRYVKAKGYGGVMMWSLDLDDFAGKFCGQENYPLWSAVNTECQK